MVHVEYEETMEEAMEEIADDVNKILNREDVVIITEYLPKIHNGEEVHGYGVVRVFVENGNRKVGEWDFLENSADYDYFELQEKVMGLVSGTRRADLRSEE